MGILNGVLTAHTTDEALPLTMVEVHDIVGDVGRKIDVCLKSPADLAAFYERSASA